MVAAHPLDRTVWSSLNGRHARFALSVGGACRYDPAYGAFAAVRDRSDASLTDLATLIAAHGDVVFIESDPPADVPGAAGGSPDVCVQMTAECLTDAPAPDAAMMRLRDDDGPEMLALARLTEPGPFFARTHLLGDFFGVKIDGRLVAMAGERMQPDGCTEVSGVCTHPDFRGQGYAGALMRRVAVRILDRGELPLLHAYASNHGAIALYRALGFTLRSEVLVTRLARAALSGFSQL